MNNEDNKIINIEAANEDQIAQKDKKKFSFMTFFAISELIIAAGLSLAVAYRMGYYMSEHKDDSKKNLKIVTISGDSLAEEQIYYAYKKSTKDDNGGWKIDDIALLKKRLTGDEYEENYENGINYEFIGLATYDRVTDDYNFFVSTEVIDYDEYLEFLDNKYNRKRKDNSVDYDEFVPYDENDEIEPEKIVDENGNITYVAPDGYILMYDEFGNPSCKKIIGGMEL